MKRLHIQLAVRDLQASIRFYNALFASEPSQQAPGHAAWLLDDPRLSFAITHNDGAPGLDHFGLAVSSPQAHHALSQTLGLAKLSTRSLAATTCCTPHADADEVHDPQDIVWRALLDYGLPDRILRGRVNPGGPQSCCAQP